MAQNVWPAGWWRAAKAALVAEARSKESVAWSAYSGWKVFAWYEWWIWLRYGSPSYCLTVQMLEAPAIPSEVLQWTTRSSFCHCLALCFRQDIWIASMCQIYDPQEPKEEGIRVCAKRNKSKLSSGKIRHKSRTCSHSWKRRSLCRDI